MSALGAKGSVDGLLINPFPTSPIISRATSEVDWLTLFTGRVGYAWDRTLLYAKGGIAAGETKDSYLFGTPSSNPPVFSNVGTNTNFQVGWIVGAGVEYAFAPHWSVKIEYDYVDLGKNPETFSVLVNPASATFGWDIDHKMQILKVGANYRF